MRVAPQVQVWIGLAGAIAGIVLFLAVSSPGGVLLLAASGAAALLGAVRWRRETQVQARPGSGIDELYVALVGFMFLGGTALLTYRGFVALSNDSSIAVLDFAGAALGLVLTLVVFGGILAARRFAAGKGGKLARRVFPVLASRFDDNSGRPSDRR